MKIIIKAVEGYLYKRKFVEALGFIFGKLGKHTSTIG
jgi:hypothetical protein